MAPSALLASRHRHRHRHHPTNAPPQTTQHRCLRMMERGEGAVVPRLGPVTVVRDGHAMEIPSDRSVRCGASVRSFIHPFIHSFTRSFIHSSIDKHPIYLLCPLCTGSWWGTCSCCGPGWSFAQTFAWWRWQPAPRGASRWSWTRPPSTPTAPGKPVRPSVCLFGRNHAWWACSSQCVAVLSFSPARHRHRPPRPFPSIPFHTLPSSSPYLLGWASWA